MDEHATSTDATGGGTAPARMQALHQGAYGPPEVLSVTEVDRPEAGPGQVLVRVRAAGLDRGTWHLVAGLPYLIRPIEGWRRPRHEILGLDLSGEVVAVGEGVDGLRPGTEVYGTARGALAEYVVADPARLAPKPAGISFEAAAAVPVSALTALQALRDQADVAAGQRVLILGASGGVGSYAVQLAKALGAHVTGVCSAAKAELVAGLGADEVIDYRTTDPVDGSARYGAILDIGGNRPLRALRRALTPRGTLVIVGGEGGGRLLGGTERLLRALLWSPLLRQRMRTFISSENRADLEALSAHLESGAVVPAVERVVALGDVAAELARLERGEVKGKVVVAVGAAG